MPRALTVAGFVMLCLGLLVARPASQARSADTHGRNAKPDYDRVFAQDTVKRLDIRVTAADWNRLTADMTEMAGPFGSARTGGRGGGFNVPPDPLATAACSGLVEGSACSFGAPLQSGRCTLLPMGTGLTCTALPGGGGNPPGNNPPGGNPPGAIRPAAIPRGILAGTDLPGVFRTS